MGIRMAQCPYCMSEDTDARDSDWDLSCGEPVLNMTMTCNGCGRRFSNALSYEVTGYSVFDEGGEMVYDKDIIGDE